jgi:glycosyltransferase involved in cell wall biosynthesis
LLKAMSGLRSDILLIANGVDLDRARFRIRSAPEPRIVWLRAFHKIYDPCLAVRVAAIVAKSAPWVRLTMCGADKGDGTLRETRKLIAELGMDANVILRGPISRTEVFDELDRADILLNTPRIDNTPVSVIEAMASGLCVVSTNVGGIPHLLEDGRDAILTPAGDAPRLAAAVLRLLEEPDLAAEVSIRARAKAEQFDWSNVLPQMETVFESLPVKA